MFASRVATRSARVVVPRNFTRGFADAKAAANTKPPVQLFGLDGTYASALVCRIATGTREIQGK
jgi:F-type H+-transporting ATPase subunit O